MGHINTTNEPTASGNLQLSDKTMTLYFIGVLSLLNVVLTYRHEMLSRCVVVVVVIITTVAPFMTSGVQSEDTCTSSFFCLRMVWIMLHRHYTC